MRKPRLKPKGANCVYHLMSRLVWGHIYLSPEEREFLAERIRKLAEFCGLDLITHCVMPNHFHVLAEVPAADHPSDEELLRRMEGYYGKEDDLVKMLKEAYRQAGKLPGAWRRRLRARMGDISPYMKELKQSFSRWYNVLHQRYGTLWSERFKSVLIENDFSSIRFLAAYIDLNPVRAGLVSDPRDYAYGGYAQAAAYRGVAREGLMRRLALGADWAEFHAAYRQYMLVSAGSTSQSWKYVLDPELIRAKLLEGAGDLDQRQLLRTGWRYLADGLAFGRKAFLEKIRKDHPELFSKKRKTGARRMVGGKAWGDFRILRALRVRRFG